MILPVSFSDSPSNDIVTTGADGISGFGYHGDFIMGWDETEFALQDAVDTCTNLDGEIESCALFTVISESVQQECTLDLPSVLVKEDVSGPVTSLPGDVPIYWGPGAAGAATSSGSAAATTVTTMPTLSYSAGSTASVNGSYVPGNIFKITPATTTVSETGAVTSAPSVTSAADDSLVTMGTSTYTYTGDSGDVTVSVVVFEEAITWTTELTTTTVVVEPTAAARLRRDAHVHQHRHAHGHRH